MTESDRQLLAPLLTSGGPYMFGRGGGSPAEIAEFDRRAERLLELARDGYVEIVGSPMMDYTRPGDHYYAISARLTSPGSDALRSPVS